MIRLQPASAKEPAATAPAAPPVGTKFPFPPPDLPQYQQHHPHPHPHQHQQQQQLHPNYPHQQHQLQQDVIIECDGNNVPQQQQQQQQTSGSFEAQFPSLLRHHQQQNHRRRKLHRVGRSSRFSCTPAQCRRALFASLICLILGCLAVGAALTVWGAVVTGHRSTLAAGTILLLCGVGLFFYSCCTTSHYARVYSGINNNNSISNNNNNTDCHHFFQHGHSINLSGGSFHGNGCSSCYYSPASPMRLRHQQQQQQQQQHQQLQPCQLHEPGRIVMPQPGLGRNSITDMIQETVPRCLLNRQHRRHSSLAASIPPVL